MGTAGERPSACAGLQHVRRDEALGDPAELERATDHRLAQAPVAGQQLGRYDHPPQVAVLGGRIAAATAGRGRDAGAQRRRGGEADGPRAAAHGSVTGERQLDHGAGAGVVPTGGEAASVLGSYFRDHPQPMPAAWVVAPAKAAIAAPWPSGERNRGRGDGARVHAVTHQQPEAARAQLSLDQDGAAAVLERVGDQVVEGAGDRRRIAGDPRAPARQRSSMRLPANVAGVRQRPTASLASSPTSAILRARDLAPPLTIRSSSPSASSASSSWPWRVPADGDGLRAASVRT